MTQPFVTCNVDIGHDRPNLRSVAVAETLLFRNGMRVRITRAPRGVVDGISLHYYHLGEAYDVSSQLAEYLVAAGYASIEMRQRQRSSRPRSRERRRPARPLADIGSGSSIFSPT
jgi:hypothetical protein